MAHPRNLFFHYVREKIEKEISIYLQNVAGHFCVFGVPENTLTKFQGCARLAQNNLKCNRRCHVLSYSSKPPGGRNPRTLSLSHSTQPHGREGCGLGVTAGGCMFVGCKGVSGGMGVTRGEASTYGVDAIRW